MISTPQIIRAVSAATGVRQGDILGPRRSASLVTARHVAMYLVWTLTGASYPELGRAFGRRHHTTVISAVRSMHARRYTDMKIHSLIVRVSDSLGVGFIDEPTVRREAITESLAMSMNDNPPESPA